MTAKNDVTGDTLATKPASEAYRDNWELIFGKKEEPVKVPDLDAVTVLVTDEDDGVPE